MLAVCTDCQSDIGLDDLLDHPLVVGRIVISLVECPRCHARGHVQTPEAYFDRLYDEWVSRDRGAEVGVLGDAVKTAIGRVVKQFALDLEKVSTPADMFGEGVGGGELE